MFRATSCSSTGESTVLVQHLVYVTLCRWPFRVQVGDLQTKRSPTQSAIYQRLYWYNWFSWWWARGCSKHVENLNKYAEKNCASSWSFAKNHNEIHGQQNEFLNVTNAMQKFQLVGYIKEFICNDARSYEYKKRSAKYKRGYSLTGGPSRNLPGGTEEHHDKPHARTKYIFCRNLRSIF